MDLKKFYVTSLRLYFAQGMLQDWAALPLLSLLSSFTTTLGQIKKKVLASLNQAQQLEVLCQVLGSVEYTEEGSRPLLLGLLSSLMALSLRYNLNWPRIRPDEEHLRLKAKALLLISQLSQEVPQEELTQLSKVMANFMASAKSTYFYADLEEILRSVGKVHLLQYRPRFRKEVQEPDEERRPEYFWHEDEEEDEHTNFLKDVHSHHQSTASQSRRPPPQFKTIRKTRRPWQPEQVKRHSGRRRFYSRSSMRLSEVCEDSPFVEDSN